GCCHGELSGPESACVRRATGSGHLPTARAKLPESVSTAKWSCSGSRSWKLRRRYRHGRGQEPSHLDRRKGVGTYSLANRYVPRQLFPVSDDAIRRSPSFDFEHADGTEGSAEIVSEGASADSCQTGRSD